MSYRRLPLTALRSFEATARHLSMKDAAAELGVTAGAVSQQIRSIEEHIKVDLFIRSHRQLALTGDGSSLYRTLRRNFAEIERALDEITAALPSAKIRLRIPPSLTIRWLVPRLASFYGQYPGFDVEFASGVAVDGLPDDDVDFACRVGKGEWEGLESIMLFRDAFVPVCSPAMGRKVAGLSDALAYPWLHSMMRMDAWSIWLKASGAGDVVAKTELRFANAALACQAAQEGVGIAMAQHAYVTADLRAGSLVVPFGQPVQTQMGYFLVCSSHNAQIPKNRVFVEWLKSAVELDA